MELPGYRVARTLGIVRGVTVRSRSLIGTIGAGIQSLFGGNITLWTELCEHARMEAFELMARHAEQMGANAVIGMRYDANEVAQGATEVLAYGTAVLIEPER
ncbi:MAG TPA: YbjQ family protein [Thermoanaerobaculia bacterium]